jgi:hypothetical protein
MATYRTVGAIGGWDDMDLDPGLPIGQRIKLLRERRGLSRAVVAGLCGRSLSRSSTAGLGVR